MSGVENSVENYQSYLAACSAVMVFQSNEIHFVSLCQSFSCSNMISLTFFPLRILLLAVENV